MFKDNRYINAGTNEFYRYGHKAVEMLEACLEPNEKGYYSICTDGGKYYTIGTSEGRYGEYARFGDTCFSVNRGGFMWAKEGTPKAEAFIKAIRGMVEAMNKKNQERLAYLEALNEDEE